MKDEIPRCEYCGEPLYAHPGTQYKNWHHDMEANFDLVKSENWHTISTKNKNEHWLSRDLFLSVRFIGLLKKLKAKGIYQYLYSEYKKLLPAEKLWIDNAFSSIEEDLRIPQSKDISEDEIQWLRDKIERDSDSEDNSESFRSRFKAKSTKLIEVLLSIHTEIVLDKEAGIKIVPFQSWEINVSIDSKKIS